MKPVVGFVWVLCKYIPDYEVPILRIKSISMLHQRWKLGWVAFCLCVLEFSFVLEILFESMYGKDIERIKWGNTKAEDDTWQTATALRKVIIPTNKYFPSCWMLNFVTKKKKENQNHVCACVLFPFPAHCVIVTDSFCSKGPKICKIYLLYLLVYT